LNDNKTRSCGEIKRNELIGTFQRISNESSIVLPDTIVVDELLTDLICCIVEELALSDSQKDEFERISNSDYCNRIKSLKPLLESFHTALGSNYELKKRTATNDKVYSAFEGLYKDICTIILPQKGISQSSCGESLTWLILCVGRLRIARGSKPKNGVIEPKF
jgi:hypothetical protein